MAAVKTPSPPAQQHLGAYTTYNSNGLLASGVVETEGVVAKEVRISNRSGGARFVQLFNSATVPADASVPDAMPVSVNDGETISIGFGEDGRQFATGLAWCSSSTYATKTLGGADFWIEIDYRKVTSP